MAMPVQVSFHNMDRCDVLEKAITRHVTKLKTLYGRVMACRVVVVASQRREHRIKVVDVVVDLSIPGEDLVTRSRTGDDARPDADAAVNEAFERAARRLRERRERQLASRIATRP
jgi:putative sigma-54 modulation protein